MANFNGTILTNQGKNLLAKAISGTRLQFTKIKLGDGVWNSTVNPENLTSLVSPKIDLPIQAIEVSGGTAKLRFVLTNNGITNGFFVREIGIYAQDPQAGEILYAVSYASNPDFIPTPDVTKLELVVDIYTVVSNAQNVTAVISDTIVLATRDDINKHNTNSTAHADIRNSITGLQNGKANIDLSNITSLGKILQLDGAGSGLDADTVDGIHETVIVRTDAAKTISAQHTFNPSTAGAPFILGANAQGQLVTGLNADKVDGYDVGNSSGQIPVSNGTLCTNLNADKVDGIDETVIVRTDSAKTITVRHTFNPSTAGAPFILGANAQGQLVTGLNADTVDGKHANGFWGAIPYIGNDGVMEIGKYIDFHLSSNSTADYEPRLEAIDANNLAINGKKIWHAGNMGSGSGLNADMVDSFHASQTPQANTIPVANNNGRLDSNYILNLPGWKVWVDTTSSGRTSPSSFTKSYDGFYVSLGDIYFLPVAVAAYSYLMQMKIKAPGDISIQQVLHWSDDNVYFYLNGTQVANYTGAGAKNATITWNLNKGENLLQIVWNNSGGAGGLLLFGDFFLRYPQLQYLGW